jgi:hypothetical protein
MPTIGVPILLLCTSHAGLHTLTEPSTVTCKNRMGVRSVYERYIKGEDKEIKM